MRCSAHGAGRGLGARLASLGRSEALEPDRQAVQLDCVAVADVRNLARPGRRWRRIRQGQHEDERQPHHSYSANAKTAARISSRSGVANTKPIAARPKLSCSSIASRTIVLGMLPHKLVECGNLSHRLGSARKDEKGAATVPSASPVIFARFGETTFGSGTMMDQGIRGHRELGASEVHLMNLLKEHEDSLNTLLDAVNARLDQAGDPEAKRWLSLARNHLESGIMFAVRAVARPTEGLGRNPRLRPLRPVSSG